jgi:16S rRNA (cytosine967-C5)-methyltransferase
MGARQTALSVLMACRREGAWSNGILKEYIQRDGLDRREAALATRLSYGVLQNRLLLDFYLKQLLTGKVRDLHPVVRDVLHLGLYQLYLMDKIPESAAVNEAVELCKKFCPKQKNGPALVNGVLRNAIRSKDALTQPRSYQEIYSHPQKLIDLLCDYVGKPRLSKMLAANNDIPPTVVQVNTLRCDTETLMSRLEQEGVAVTNHPWLADCLVLTATGSLERLESFREGLFYVQDAAAKLSVLCAEIPKNARVLDCCAAPGGKSFAAAMAGAGEITSCDIHPHKVPLIEKGAERLGIECLHACCMDASVHNPQWENAMDVVIADVPCSGYGIIRKKPDIRYKDPDTMLDLPQLQLAILENQSRYVRDGGVLMYSTCTLVHRENEGVVAQFLQNHPEYHTEPLTLPDALPKNESGMLTLVSGEYDTDGFFICRLRKD